jgi:linoleoyl-CoA desaturase
VVVGAVSLGLAMAGVGFNIQHDGNHGSYSRHAWVNRMMSLTLDLLGGTAYFWHFKHNIAHHTHPNIAGQDDDISLGVLGRVSPHQRWRPFHRFQWIYMWLLYAGVCPAVAAGRRVPEPGVQALVRHHPRAVSARPGTGDLLGGQAGVSHPGVRLAGDVASVRRVVLTYLVSVVTLGLVLATVFQVAHVSDAAEFRAPEAGGSAVARPWAEHQVETTVNFARGNRCSTGTWRPEPPDRTPPVSEGLPRSLCRAVAHRGARLPATRRALFRASLHARSAECPRSLAVRDGQATRSGGGTPCRRRRLPYREVR